MRCTVDTNVPVVANGHSDSADGGRTPTIDCRLASIEFLKGLLNGGKIVLDLEGEIQGEYHRNLNLRGQPGVGDRFYLAVINSAPRLVERVSLPKQGNGEYDDFPNDPALNLFHQDDRKFAALSRKERIPVVNATDSDWVNYKGALERNGVSIKFICGCDPARWFDL